MVVVPREHDYLSNENEVDSESTLPVMSLVFDAASVLISLI